MMTKSDKERFNNRICVGHVLVSADIYVTPVMTESAAEVELTVPNDDYQKAMDLYDRICQFALLHGEDLQGLFKNSRYYYMSCFVRDVEAFKKEFEKEEELKPLFNHDKGDTAEFLISFPEKVNYDDKEPVKKSFLEITQKHVDSLDELTWLDFEHRAFTGGTVGFDDERDNITKLSRKDFVASNLTDSFEDDFYVNPLYNKAEKIGEIDGYPVFFNRRGFYFYWNKETEYLLESWLTFPAYPYGW
ncbi:hypothetical protein I5420_22505 [Citrobacter koseri]|uniref:hypothetical protein n=1 Tax=Enterobacteriaceae TaxID=543 RepID=UPI000CEC337B|nr:MULTISPECIES: hypothetical protein [Enterobacteriaceae]EEH4986614.1 hypothetical protein [Salmonella enterica]EKW8462733.1 hypothetical protein [Enterobacter hormaechei]HAV1718723.1 hypothetical protein [Enterobacter hormaechei subsp. steigerwaltii]MBJ8918612.1 hypothetical protein [Citrobacter koseri]ROC44141.1 hypothetical protein C4Z30_023000 [Klebsiella pneumoniae subsp. pneumoniae]